MWEIMKKFFKSPAPTTTTPTALAVEIPVEGITEEEAAPEEARLLEEAKQAVAKTVAAFKAAAEEAAEEVRRLTALLDAPALEGRSFEAEADRRRRKEVEGLLLPAARKAAEKWAALAAEAEEQQLLIPPEEWWGADYMLRPIASWVHEEMERWRERRLERGTVLGRTERYARDIYERRRVVLLNGHYYVVVVEKGELYSASQLSEAEFEDLKASEGEEWLRGRYRDPYPTFRWVGSPSEMTDEELGIVLAHKKEVGK